MKRLFYEDLEIGQKVRVQKYYGRLTNNFYSGEITNMDGQNIVVHVDSRQYNEMEVDGEMIRIREYEACNPLAANVEVCKI
jgi:hypothetical protein